MAEQVMELMRERDMYKKENWQLAEDLDQMKQLRDAELGAVMLMCENFECKLVEIRKQQQHQ